MTPGQKIKQLRRLKGWSQEQTADKLNLSLQVYGRIERDIADITYSRIIQLSKLFGVDPTELLNSQKETLLKKVAEQNATIAALNAEISGLQRELLEYIKEEKKQTKKKGNRQGK